MKNFRDIDAFFNGQKPFEEKIEVAQQTLRVRVLRFLKLAMPSFAAVLIVMILLFPTLKKNTVVADFDVTLPQKGELEKLHIVQTEFSVTDKDNKVSTFTADRIDETEPGSKLVKIINPKGRIPTETDEAFVHIDSDVGYYDQKENIIQTRQNVKAVHDNGTTVLTQAADYDFNQSVGKGDEDVYAYGEWGKLWAEGFEYHQQKDLLILSGKSKILADNREIRADRQIRYYRAENRLEAEGHVLITEADQSLAADKVIAYLDDKHSSQIKKAEAFGHVVVTSPQGTAQGRQGVYTPERSEVELTGDVVIEQDGNRIYGQKAVTNLQTSVSRITAGKEKGNRVSGIIRGSSIKGKKHEKN